MMRDVLYFERQSLHGWGNALALFLGVLGLVLLLPLPGGEETIGPERGIPGVILVLAAVVILNLLTMSTWVYPDEIKVQFGRLIPYYHRHIPLAKVREVRVVQVGSDPPAGPGAGQGEWDREETQFLNTRGGSAVMVQGPERRVVIGTAYPERLAEVVERALRNRETAPQSAESSEA